MCAWCAHIEKNSGECRNILLGAQVSNKSSDHRHTKRIEKNGGKINQQMRGVLSYHMYVIVTSKNQYGKIIMCVQNKTLAY